MSRDHTGSKNPNVAEVDETRSSISSCGTGPHEPVAKGARFAKQGLHVLLKYCAPLPNVSAAVKAPSSELRLYAPPSSGLFF